MTKEEIQKYLCDWSNERTKRNDSPTDEVAEEILLYCYESQEETERHPGRWWDELAVVGKYGDKYFAYEYFAYGWASVNRDESVFDLGREFDWSSVEEVEAYTEMVEVRKYRPVQE